ncbi:hypothetical protein ACFC66_37070, partial [Streptomyces bacillaris]
PDRAAAPQHVHGALFVDMDNFRARYECTRPGCPQPKEGPVCANDRLEGNDGLPVRRGALGVAHFIAGIKTHHLNTYHGGTP